MQIEITPEYLSSQGLSENFPDRFWSKVNKQGPCWDWVARVNRCGYGTVAMDCERGKPNRGKNILSHRAAWILTVGPIPERMHVLHRCDNPACVNPDHLFMGTPFINNHDMIRKGREKHPVKIPWESVLEIRRLRATSDYTLKEIADMFSCHNSHVHAIVHFRRRSVK